MKFRHKFNSLHELEERLGPRFAERLEQLICAYNKAKRNVDRQALLRMLNIAWEFLLMAQSGNMATANNFDLMMHGFAPDHIEFDGTPLLLDGDESTEEWLLWDGACLMLEEMTPGDEMPQFVYDFVGRHNRYAYEVCRECDTRVEITPTPVYVPVEVTAASTLDPLAMAQKEIEQLYAIIRRKDEQIANLTRCLEMAIANTNRHTTINNFYGAMNNNGGTMVGDITDATYNK